MWLRQKSEGTKLKIYKQMRDKSKKKKNTKKLVSPKKNKRVDGRIERRGKGRDTLLFNTLFQRTCGENRMQANT